MTREEAIEAIKCNWPDSRYTILREALEMAISAIRQRDVTDANVGKWISVKDRLPEAGGYVVCIAKRNPFSRFMPMVARIEKNGWANPITEQYISEVTHWMPLPEPPEDLD